MSTAEAPSPGLPLSATDSPSPPTLRRLGRRLRLMLELAIVLDPVPTTQLRGMKGCCLSPRRWVSTTGGDGDERSRLHVDEAIASRTRTTKALLLVRRGIPWG